ncbi:hypothetical protein GLOIN_2v1004476 [Rhizophagus clarus]|uniref:C2H2-type domain-containing protein n=1 Tax=Rhizophagus clarus TaxID=94130 RepID=A0A8H3QSM3_9GLOM|nr:hypothetical protein GLOIN_2v1004476 [Rhizophagus clarus]
MVNQTNQNIIHNCKWVGCTDKFDSMLSLWKHVEQQHVDNAIPRLIHFVNDDDDIPVTSPQNNTAMTKSSIDFVATSQINQSHSVYPAHINTINTIVGGTGNINNGQNLTSMLPNLNLNLQDTFGQFRNAQMIQTTYLSSQTQKQRHQYNNYLLQQNLLQQQLQQQQLQQQTLILTGQAMLGSMPNPIPIDDNNTMDVGSPTFFKPEYKKIRICFRKNINWRFIFETTSLGWFTHF